MPKLKSIFRERGNIRSGFKLFLCGRELLKGKQDFCYIFLFISKLFLDESAEVAIFCAQSSFSVEAYRGTKLANSGNI